MNVDIFVHTNFCGFSKIGIFSWIRICVFRINDALGYNKSDFHGVHIFSDIQEAQITHKYVQHENVYIHSIYRWAQSRLYIMNNLYILYSLDRKPEKGKKKKRDKRENTRAHPQSHSSNY